ncbi:hypothetical protein DSL72_005022 [Monilinia vaccinii-corymbosi]|uniref:Uncharacterized protein n=1 Tax=Monilinia vaccinii-corymbosi TaxID=61207 RepID=A0A8A3PEG8_9HELO|nr:hypothetical protein DSL72_005022 [Monilinia vaccinii-corymbosi]
MGLIRSTFTTALLGAAGAASGWAFWTRNSKFIPISPTDPIFSSPAYIRQNPNRNPATQDLCQRKVPLSKIKPQLLEKEKEGKLVEAFCAGVWSGYGYAYQRSYLSKKYQNTTTTAHQLWTPPQLLSSTYEVGTQITDHFEVVSKTPTSIVVRCGDSPLNTGVRDSDGLFEIKASIDRSEGVAIFELKSVFFKGKGRTSEKPMPEHVEFAHRLYTKLWMETAIGNCMIPTTRLLIIRLAITTPQSPSTTRLLDIRHLSTPFLLLPPTLPHVSKNISQRRKHQYRGAQRHGPTRGLYVAQDDPELEHDPQDSDEGPDLKDRPKAPVDLDEVFPITILDVEKGEDFNDDGDQGEKETERYDGKEMDAQTTDTPYLTG